VETLIKNFKDLLLLTPLNFKRYLYSEIAWDDRMIGIVEQRGVGKTTMLLQYIKENLDVNETLYVQASPSSTQIFKRNRIDDFTAKSAKI
jgi:predicted AAA+ superfamily ATPase